MQITERCDGPLLILSLDGRLDHEGAQVFQAAAVRHIEAGERRILVDFGGISFVASLGIRALILPTQLAAQSGGRLCITGLGPSVRNLFETAGLDRMFTVFESVEEALADQAWPQ
jgi:anti-sigma B factor antagonist